MKVTPQKENQWLCLENLISLQDSAQDRGFVSNLLIQCYVAFPGEIWKNGYSPQTEQLSWPPNMIVDPNHTFEWIRNQQGKPPGPIFKGVSRKDELKGEPLPQQEPRYKEVFPKSRASCPLSPLGLCVSIPLFLLPAFVAMTTQLPLPSDIVWRSAVVQDPYGC